MVEVRNTNLHSQTGCPATKIVSNARSCRHSLEAVVRTGPFPDLAEIGGRGISIHSQVLGPARVSTSLHWLRPIMLLSDADRFYGVRTEVLVLEEGFGIPLRHPATLKEEILSISEPFMASYKWGTRDPKP